MASFDFSPPVIAHRGASGYAPENTMASFVKAAQLGIKWVEFDVVLAKCGTPIIFHDETLDRTSNAHGLIDDYTYTQLQAFDAGKWFHPHFSSERIPTLAQVLVFLYEAGMSANVEIKPMPGKEEETVENTLETFRELNRNGVYGAARAYSEPRPSGSGVIREATKTKRGNLPNDVPQILFSSFSVPSLRHLRRLAPDCSIGLLLEQWDHDWQSISDELKCVSINAHELIITQESAQKVKQSGHYLLCYTVNNPMRAQELFAMGVDAVFSDYPDTIIKELVHG